MKTTSGSNDDEFRKRALIIKHPVGLEKPETC